jgi:DNA-binding MarR family transcriptional regulator
MEVHYQTLRTIYEIAKHDPKPQTYLCRPREIILRQFMDWGIIQQHLKLLEDEKLITTKQLNTLVISITTAGIKLLENKDYIRTEFL